MLQDTDVELWPPLPKARCSKGDLGSTAGNFDLSKPREFMATIPSKLVLKSEYHRQQCWLVASLASLPARGK